MIIAPGNCTYRQRQFKPKDNQQVFVDGLVGPLHNGRGVTERAGFDLPSLCKVLYNLILQLNSNDNKDINCLVDLLFLHDFLLSRDMF